jgi:pyrimidine operon attenuation protein/uracil phosphoribosyltransferase
MNHSTQDTVGPVVMDAADVGRVLTRISHQILEQAKGHEDLVLLGIPTRGALLAERIGELIGSAEDTTIPVGSLDVTMYRDDLQMHPARVLGHTEIPEAGIDGKTVILVDDVLFSGRTVRAALDAIKDIGRPSTVRLAVLVDRGHRELPIRADHVGKNLPTNKGESVRLRLKEIDGVDEILLLRQEGT